MKFNLLASDFDGTLLDINSSSWFLITSALGCEKEDSINEELFKKGKISYAEWSRRTIELYKKYGLTKKKFIELASSQKLVDSCVETLKKLRERGLKTCIISGGIKNFYDYFEKKEGLKVDFPRFCTELFFDEEGKLIGGTYSNYDYEGKIEVLKEICNILKISSKEVVFVGDSENDLPIFKVVGLSVAISPKSKNVEREADIILNTFSDLIEVVG